jgi:two-component system, NtrC family, sensor kinase
MRLAAKLVSLLLVGLVILLGIDGYLSVRYESAFLQAEMERNAGLLGRMIKGEVVDAWRAGGEKRALGLIADANQDERSVRIRWVWLDNLPNHRSRPLVANDMLGPVRQGEKASFREVQNGGEDFLVTYVPVQLGKQGTGAIELSEGLDRLVAHERRMIVTTISLIGALMVAGGAAVALLGTQFVARPLQQLMEKVRRVGQGDLTHPVEMRRHDELSTLASALNAMCEQLAEARDSARRESAARIAALEQLRHAERLTTVGRLASGVAHELGTPLNTVSAIAKQIASGGIPQTRVREEAGIVRSQVDRMTAIIRQLLNFARVSPLQKSPADLRQLARQTTELLTPLARERNVTLHVLGGDEPVMADVDAGQIRQVVTNLIVNATQAMPNGGTVSIGFRATRMRPPGALEMPESDYVFIDVVDEGEGIAPDVMDRLFEPFFTTKGIGEGTGLGLSVAYGIIQEHGGVIKVESDRGKGSRFSVCLPCDRGPQV